MEHMIMNDISGRERMHRDNASRYYRIILIFVTASLLFPDTNARVRQRIAENAMAQVGVTVLYDPAYVKLGYPMGDVPKDRGVCTDVVIRAFRAVGVDLQKEIHEDLKRHFTEYPNNYRMTAPDRNIDHRRVEYIATYMRRNARSVSLDETFLPGDLVVWRLNSGRLHIGVVATGKVHPKEDRYFVVHNIGSGTLKEDVLFSYKIIGHYRW